MSDLSENVFDWLTRSGYPLEMVVAQALTRSGFAVVQSEYVEDVESSKWRETDVVAYSQETFSNGRALFALVIECKGNPDKPWVIFTGRDTYPPGLNVVRRATTTAGESILGTLSSRQDVQESYLFRLPDRPGYSLTVALRNPDNNRDVAFEALNSVCKAALGLVKRLGSAASHSIIPLVWPAIVINAPLFECYLDDEGLLKLQPLDRSVLIWKNPMITRHTIVNIFTKQSFLAETSNLASAARELTSLVAAEQERSPRSLK